MAPADCWACAMPPQPAFWSACDGGSEKISGAGDQSRNKAVLGCRGPRQVHDQALHVLRRAALLSALHLPVLFLRQDGVGRSFRRSFDLYFQPDAEIAEWALRHRLRYLKGRSLAANQYRRLRHRYFEDRPEGEGGIQADRRRAAAVLYAGVSFALSPCGRGRQPKGCRVRGLSPRTRWICGANP